MFRIYILLLIPLVSSCLDSAPTGPTYPDVSYNTTLYTVYTPDPNWTRAVVVSSNKDIDRDEGMITILRTSWLPKNRVVFSVDMIPSVWGYTPTGFRTLTQPYEYLSSQVGVIKELRYPYVTFDIGKFNYYQFLNEYRSEPKYKVGDAVRFISTNDTLQAIWE